MSSNDRQAYRELVGASVRQGCQYLCYCWQSTPSHASPLREKDSSRCKARVETKRLATVLRIDCETADIEVCPTQAKGIPIQQTIPREWVGWQEDSDDSFTTSEDAKDDSDDSSRGRVTRRRRTRFPRRRRGYQYTDERESLREPILERPGSFRYEDAKKEEQDEECKYCGLSVFDRTQQFGTRAVLRADYLGPLSTPLQGLAQFAKRRQSLSVVGKAAHSWKPLRREEDESDGTPESDGSDPSEENSADESEYESDKIFITTSSDEYCESSRVQQGTGDGKQPCENEALSKTLAEFRDIAADEFGWC